MTKYEALINSKIYSDMTEDEQNFCKAYEASMYLPRIEKLREAGVEDYKIGAYLRDLYNNYLVCDDVYIANEAGISDEDYEKGDDYYWFEMDENPLC